MFFPLWRKLAISNFSIIESYEKRCDNSIEKMVRLFVFAVTKIFGAFAHLRHKIFDKINHARRYSSIA